MTPELLSEITRKIAAWFDPEKIIWFGSHVWGTPERDSDADLLVVMESNERPARRMAEVSASCRPRFLATHVLALTPAELQRRLDIGDPFYRRIMEQGRSLHERRAD